ncbi:MAG TPA: phosphatidylserine/phosphatidylglycerophosphate/cardiolipin synthase family protein [Thermoanaerobaculia bacterium]|nr:phosphatidylserine/phosphatidylglycerophosphate/cardiolipin synthase family protein [Thermoanaerobaculia bacterium]
MHRSVCLVLTFALAATPAGADVFRLLDDPRDAAQARVDIIQQADDEISAMYFLARDDRITLGALALLRDAKRRGVPRVRLIVDAGFHRIPKAVLAHLRDEGVEIKVYHPFTLRHPSWLLRRMHEKVVVVDGKRYITGGRNLAEAYFGLADGENYVDRDVYVDGPSAADADRHFESLWSSKHVAKLRVHVSRNDKEIAAQILGEVLSELERTGFIALNTGRDWSEGQKQVDAVRFLHDPVDGDSPRLAAHLAKILESAEESIVIESPYFVPSKSMRTLLYRKLGEGVKVQVLTNSLRSTDGILPQAAYLKYRRRMLRAGMDVREFKGPDPLHAKTIVVDSRIVLVGSYNIDPRSEFFNTEVMCLVEDEEIARETLRSIDTHLDHAWTIQRGGEDVHEVSPATSLRVWAARLILPLIENQL